MIETVLRLVLGIGLGLLALLSGCKGTNVYDVVTPDYGVPPPPEHPTVQLMDFSHTPSEAIHAGETTTLTATTNLPISEARIRAFPKPQGEGVTLLDDGQPPDEVAGDAVWTADYTWPADSEPTSEAYFYVKLSFDDYYMFQTLYSEKFEVLPAEEE
jgi:hypothetical protein